ncbi:MAG TPA: sigma 54-interacting transcriptional regulator [bacterium]|nr:sigma 54-interacting transcriptional regulator [Candidatus Omnitrophota bacterium]HOJ60939.1 sigma 54-interacting transcriptional regulator [bacterium]HOL93616.1 sigma 54-interacting transcriptional regulator [bacterium]HPP00087.1 sigma 54-interacting transcriptional regulator [bacterium]
MTRKKVGFAHIICKNPRMQQIVRTAQRIANSDMLVLITGEDGTGKETLAQAIHNDSDRGNGRFVSVNCAALPDALLETELFGHEKGAFTGAVYSRKGKFEQAQGGTLFLDEIGEMSLPTQARLLRVLEEGVTERIGGGEPIPLDVRIITASNENLYNQVKEGTFRQDLYYRLKEVNLDLPPLRERKEDIPPLVDYFIKQYNKQYHKSIEGISDAALQFLLRHDWPGNVRELHHVVKCAVLMNDAQDTIWLEHIPLDIHLAESSRSKEDKAETKAEELLEILSLDEAEKRHILRILEFTRFNKSQAANILKISRPTLDRKIEKYQLHNIKVQEKLSKSST